MLFVSANVTPPGAQPRATTSRRMLETLRRWAGPVIDPTPVSLRRLALASVAATAGIVATGAAVRLSKSGLGCPTWPDCTKSSLVAAHSPGDPMFHTWIEFGNRLVTFILLAVAVAVVVAAWRFRDAGPSGPRRRWDLVWLAVMQPLGVAAQAAIGGVVVLTGLNPFWVSFHFVVSVAVVAAAVMLHVRCTEGTGPAVQTVRRELRLLALGLVAVCLLMLVAGTVVTGTGPLAGAGNVPRYHLALSGVTQFHADVGWTLGWLAFALMLGLRLTSAPSRARQAGYWLLGLVAVQGGLGYLQYFTGLPAGLVWVHESASILIWVAALRAWFATRDRGAIAVPPAVPEGTAAAGAVRHGPVPEGTGPGSAVSGGAVPEGAVTPRP
jgi:cytochrome c oxidase assembly protein subunit 15